MKAKNHQSKKAISLHINHKYISPQIPNEFFNGLNQNDYKIHMQK